MAAASKLCSVTRRRTAGLNSAVASAPAAAAAGGEGAAEPVGEGAPGGDAGAGVALVLAVAVGVRAGGLALGDFPLGSIWATTSPTRTVSPSFFRRRKVPAPGDGNSTLALSVSSSSSASSARTTSPSALSQRTITPSVTDSPSVGICTSTGMGLPHGSYRHGLERAVDEIGLFGFV